MIVIITYDPCGVLNLSSVPNFAVGGGSNLCINIGALGSSSLCLGKYV